MGARTQSSIFTWTCADVRTWEQTTKGCPQAALDAFASFFGLALVVAGALPRHQFLDGGVGAGDGVLVCLHIGAGSLFANRANAETHFLLARIHLDDLELVLQA